MKVLLNYLKASKTKETVQSYGAQRYCEQNDQHFILLRSIGVYGNRRRLSTREFIFRAHAGAHRFTAQC